MKAQYFPMPKVCRKKRKTKLSFIIVEEISLAVVAAISWSAIRISLRRSFRVAVSIVSRKLCDGIIVSHLRHVAVIRFKEPVVGEPRHAVSDRWANKPVPRTSSAGRRKLRVFQSRVKNSSRLGRERERESAPIVTWVKFGGWGDWARTCLLRVSQVERRRGAAPGVQKCDVGRRDHGPHNPSLGLQTQANQTLPGKSGRYGIKGTPAVP